MKKTIFTFFACMTLCGVSFAQQILYATIPQYSDGSMYAVDAGSGNKTPTVSISTNGYVQLTVIPNRAYEITVVPVSGSSYAQFSVDFSASTDPGPINITPLLMAGMPSPTPTIFPALWVDTPYLGVAGLQYHWPVTQGTGPLCNDGSGNFTWGGCGGGGGDVDSVFGRTGDVTAHTGDYSFSLISGTVAPGQLPLATTSAFGAVKCDGTTITCTDGTIASVVTGGVSQIIAGSYITISPTNGIGVVTINGNPSCINTGVWSDTTAYTLCQFAIDNSGNIYQALVNVPAGTPQSDTDYWQKFPGNDNISSIDAFAVPIYQGANTPTIGPSNVHYNNTLNYFYGLNGLMGPATAPVGFCPVNGVTTIAQDNTVTTCMGNTQVPFTGAGSGIASIAWTVPSFMTATPTTIDASGTQEFSFNNQAANLVFAGPASGGSGAVGPRALVAADIPAISTLSGVLIAAQLPPATTTALGAVIPDNTSIAIDGTTHKISVIGGGSLPSFCNTITASTLTCTNFTATNDISTPFLSSSVINNTNETFSGNFVATSNDTLRYLFGSDTSGTGFDSNDGSGTDTVINAAVGGAGYTSTFTETGFTSLSFGIRGGAAGVTCTGGVAQSVLGIVTTCGSSSGSIGTAGQIQMVGSTAGSFAASHMTDNGTVINSTEPITVGSTPATACGSADGGCYGALSGTVAATPASGQAAILPLSDGWYGTSNGTPVERFLTQGHPPVLTILAAGTSGTFTPAADTTRIRVLAVGCGGGGGGSGVSSGNGSNCGGANTTFGSLTAGFGGGGVSFFGASAAGGAATSGTTNIIGNAGNPILVGITTQNGSNGAASCLGGGAAPGGFAQSDVGDATGADAVVPGSGGGGAAANGNSNPGPGGAAGGCVDWYTDSPASTYAYSVADTANGGIAGTGGAPGGDGAAGIIYVWEYKQ